jgi:hypothetical protein
MQWRIYYFHQSPVVLLSLESIISPKSCCVAIPASSVGKWVPQHPSPLQSAQNCVTGCFVVPFHSQTSQRIYKDIHSPHDQVVLVIPPMPILSYPETFFFSHKKLSKRFLRFPAPESFKQIVFVALNSSDPDLGHKNLLQVGNP